MKLRAADLFCGAGGTAAGARASELFDIVYGLNHNKTAIATFMANFPDAIPANCKIEAASPVECGRLDALFASPSCVQHSMGHTGVIEEQERAHAYDVLRWLDYCHPEWLVVENVVQFADWGPLGKDGRPLKSKKGVFFKRWCDSISDCGYKYEWRKLNAKHYGAGTDRERFVLIARRHKTPNFPEATHGDSDLFGDKLPYVTARQFLDLSNLGDPIEGRICENTLRRIAHGRARFGNDPFLVKYFGTGISASIDEPISTFTTKARHALVIGDTLRVLTVKELKLLQSFDEEYILCGTQAEQILQIGNSVPPIMMTAVCLALGA